MRENLYTYVNAANWNDLSFDLNKAYVCAKFSELVYEYKPTELKDRTTLYEIDDETLQKYKNIREFNQQLRNSDFNLLFIVESKKSVTIGISLFRVVIVASRGTTVKKDWLINLNFFKSRGCNLYKLDFHLGFHGIALNTLKKIHDRLAQEDAPIYFTGHSLGGALTGILYFYFRSNCNCKGHFSILKRNTICAYSFGMPKFATKKHEIFDNLYHIYNNKDGVPATPPKSLGYVQSGNQFELSTEGLTSLENKKFISFGEFMSIVFRGEIVKEHIMKKYLLLLKTLIQN